MLADFRCGSGSSGLWLLFREQIWNAAEQRLKSELFDESRTHRGEEGKAIVGPALAGRYRHQRCLSDVRLKSNPQQEISVRMATSWWIRLRTTLLSRKSGLKSLP